MNNTTIQTVKLVWVLSLSHEYEGYIIIVIIIIINSFNVPFVSTLGDCIGLEI